MDARVPALAAHHEGGEEEGEGKGEGKGKEEEKGEVVPERVAESHVWLFPGANGGRWVEAVRRAYGDTTDEDEEVGGRGGLGVPEMGNSRSRTRSPDSEEDGSGEGAKKVRVV